ncbi:hypothetical protein Dimus_029814 [Dionaea muscipula]
MWFQRKEWRPIKKDSVVNLVPSCSAVEVAGGTLLEGVGLGVDCEHAASVGGAEEDASLCGHGNWQEVKGKAVARSTPRPSPVQVSASRFSPLVPGCSERKEEIGKEIVAFYGKMLGTKKQTSEEINCEAVLAGPLVTERHAMDLSADFCESDVADKQSLVLIKQQLDHLCNVVGLEGFSLSKGHMVL